MLSALSLVGVSAGRKLAFSQLASLASTYEHMKVGGYSDDEIRALLRAVYTERTKQHLREAWWVFDR